MALIETHRASWKEATMADHCDGVSRRKALACMAWAGTGVLWTISGGVAHSLGLLDQTMAPDASGLTFLQISDSHVGFAKPVNPNVKGTLEEAISRIKTMPVQPSFVNPYRRHHAFVQAIGIRRR
jgi:hypothetical protein